MGLAPGQRPFGEGLHFSVLLPLRGRPAPSASADGTGAVSFLQILAPEMHDRILTDFMEADGNIMVTMHIRGINQNEAIKMVKRKITDLDAMKIAEQKRAVRSGYDMDILPATLPPTAARQRPSSRTAKQE